MFVRCMLVCAASLMNITVFHVSLVTLPITTAFASIHDSLLKYLGPKLLVTFFVDKADILALALALENVGLFLIKM